MFLNLLAMQGLQTVNLNQSINDAISTTKSLAKVIEKESPEQLRMRVDNLLGQLEAIKKAAKSDDRK